MGCIFFSAALAVIDTLRYALRRKVNSAVAKAVYRYGADMCAAERGVYRVPPDVPAGREMPGKVCGGLRRGYGAYLSGGAVVMLSRSYSLLARASAALECKIEQKMKKAGRDNIQ